jgi:putative DNA primase/helicase
MTRRAVLLDPQDPLASARVMVDAHFTDDRGRRLLMSHRGIFWQFTQNHYVALPIADLRAKVWSFLGKAQRLVKGERVPFKPTPFRISGVVDAMAARTHVDSGVDAPAWLDDKNRRDAREFLAVKNGLLHLGSGRLLQPTPAYFALNSTDVAFDRHTDPPKLWLNFLSDLWPDDPDSIETLQDWFGYSLGSDTTQQKMLLLVGPPRSGKGTLARVHAWLVGQSSVVAPTLASLSSNFGASPLIGKRLAIISDARLGGRQDQAVIAERLLSISGEDSITIDRKFLPAWTGRLETRLEFLTNELPRFSESSGALVKRFIVLVLQRTFYGKEDPGLTEKLLDELPGILNWALVGYRRLRRRGFFVQPKRGRDAVAELESLASPITAFLQDECVIGAAKSVLVDVLFNKWRNWCDANGKRECGTIQTFGRDLRSVLPNVKLRQPRSGQDGSRQREYRGVGLERSMARNGTQP